MKRYERNLLIAIVVLVAALALALAFMSVARAYTVVPPCADWRVGKLSDPSLVLYCGATGTDAPWHPPLAGCTDWRPSRNERGWLVLTCYGGACKGLSITIYPRPL